MMTARSVTPEDVAWMVGVLARRRAALVPFAPLYWRPAVGAGARHAEWLTHLLVEGGAIGARTDASLMIAAPGPRGWVIDDAWVSARAWETEGRALWHAIIARIGPQPVTFLCPTPEQERARFAVARGLALARSWWHLEVEPGPASGAGVPGVDGAEVALVPAPPVYDPGGPVTFLRAVRSVAALDQAPGEAGRCGSPIVVVEQLPGEEQLASSLRERGYVRHCDFFGGVGRGDVRDP